MANSNLPRRIIKVLFDLLPSIPLSISSDHSFSIYVCVYVNSGFDFRGVSSLLFSTTVQETQRLLSEPGLSLLSRFWGVSVCIDVCVCGGCQFIIILFLINDCFDG